MVTNHQSEDRPISSLLGRRWNLGIAQRFSEKSSRLYSPSDAWEVPYRFPVGRRSILGQNWAKSRSLFRAVSRQWPTGDPPIPEQSPSGRQLILKIARRSASDRRGSKIRSVPAAVRRPGTELIERSPPSDLGQKSKPLRQKAADRFWTHRPVTDWSTSGDRAATGRRPGGDSSTAYDLYSGFDFWPKSLDGERSIRSAPGLRPPGHRA